MSEQLTLFAGDSHANHFPLPGTEEAKMITVTYGRSIYERLKQLNQVGLLEKMFLESSIWNSTKCYLIWKMKATPRGHLLFQLYPLTPDTGATEFGLLPTITTQEIEHPKALLNKKGRRMSYSGTSTHSLNLADTVKLFPTPTATCYKGSGVNGQMWDRLDYAVERGGGCFRPQCHRIAKEEKMFLCLEQISVYRRAG